MRIARHQIVKPAVWVLFLVLQSWLSISGAEVLHGRVVGVHDGDTVTLLTPANQQVKIRLAQIDAPESSQAFGQRSKESLSAMVYNKTIHVAKETIDKYGRTVGTLFVDGLDVNREQIRRGMAWAYRKYLHDQSLLQIEAEAQKAKVGLWSDAHPMPPWEYRHSGKTEVVAVADTFGRERTSWSGKFSCDSKHYCKEMASCEEARFYLSQCGLSRLDSDHDGSPCESLCGK